jgi:hypothetical protein
MAKTKPGPSKLDHAFAAEHLRFKHLEGHPVARDWCLGSRVLAGNVKHLSGTSGKILMRQHTRLRPVSVDWIGDGLQSIGWTSLLPGATHENPDPLVRHRTGGCFRH